MNDPSLEDISCTEPCLNSSLLNIFNINFNRNLVDILTSQPELLTSPKSGAHYCISANNVMFNENNGSVMIRGVQT